jgi:hypothetical protein
MVPVLQCTSGSMAPAVVVRVAGGPRSYRSGASDPPLLCLRLRLCWTQKELPLAGEPVGGASSRRLLFCVLASVRLAGQQGALLPQVRTEWRCDSEEFGVHALILTT